MKISDLPVGDAPEALVFDHFPNRLCAVVFRNWNLVPLARLGRVLKASAEELQALGESMGLTRDDSAGTVWFERGYVTLIRRNWELLPYEQLLELLEWDAEKLDFILREDDFLWHKMGNFKPVCPPVFYSAPTGEEKARLAEIRDIVRKYASVSGPGREAPFGFLKNYGNKAKAKRNTEVGKSDFDLRMVYSFSALYGDPLIDEKLDPFPEGALADYAASGINAVWLQGTLYTLVPWLGAERPESRGWRTRQENLRKLVACAGKYGVKIFLYFNEPRSMPEEFFLSHPGWKGERNGNTDNYALCTSAPGVLEALEKGVEELFRAVPGLGGAFTISMSENLTHCKSRFTETCPRCKDRPVAELIAEVNRAIASGAKKGDPAARIIAWSWAWRPPVDEEVMKLLPKDLGIMAVSETGVETDCFGIKGSVIDYSIAHSGPGEAARRIWGEALGRGLSPVAKVQLNCTWELSAVPYLPVPDLIEEHLKRIKACGVRDLMASWTLGGWPGGNFELLQASKEELAERKFGKNAPTILRAWKCFSDAFRQFPFHSTFAIYTAPQNFGPMSLLWARPTGRRATMIGFPYDDLQTWRGNHFPEEIFLRAFETIAAGWEEGVKLLKSAEPRIAPEQRAEFDDLLSVAEAAGYHFRSTCNQISFVLRRNAGEDFRDICDRELECARGLLEVMRRDSRIGFEASNHYFYVENDLLEKMVNSLYVKEHSSC